MELVNNIFFIFCWICYSSGLQPRLLQMLKAAFLSYVLFFCSAPLDCISAALFHWLYIVLFGSGICKGLLYTGSGCCRTIEAALDGGASWVPATWSLLFRTLGSFGGSWNWCSSCDGGWTGLGKSHRAGGSVSHASIAGGWGKPCVRVAVSIFYWLLFHLGNEIKIENYS